MLHKSLVEVGDIGICGNHIIVFTDIAIRDALFCYVYNINDGSTIMRGFSSYRFVDVVGVARGYG